jgi:formate C-acetyltransferase
MTVTTQTQAVKQDARAHSLSAQEQAIEGGQKALHGNVTDRVLRLFEAIRAAYRPRVTLERAILFTESFKTTEGQPLVLRWAKALKHIADNIPVTIFDDELIVGRPTPGSAATPWFTPSWTAAS